MTRGSQNLRGKQQAPSPRWAVTLQDMRRLVLLGLATAAAILVAGNRAPLAPMFITIVLEEISDLGQPPSSVETFTQTPDGNWRTIIKTSNGEDIWEYEPGDKFTAVIHTELTVVNAKAGLIRYTYQISNDANSVQQISHVRIGPGISGEATITKAPDSWYRFSDTGWVTVEESSMSTGIRPGTTAIAEIEGQLPGVVEVKLLGNIEYPGSVPDGLTETQYLELHQLFDRHQDIGVPALAPTIPSGSNLPEANRQRVLGIVYEHYAVELPKYRHPYRTEFQALFERSYIDKNFNHAVMQLKAIANKPVSDPWHQAISDALSTIADVLIAGST